MFLHRLYLAQFLRPQEDVGTYPEMPNALRVCCMSSSAKPADAEIWKWVKKLQPTERKKFRSGMSTLLKLAYAGRKLESHYDEKAYHPTHRFDYKGEERVVWRIRIGDLRLLLYHGEDGIVLLTDAFPKHRNQLTEAQKNKAERDVQAFLDAGEFTFI